MRFWIFISLGIIGILIATLACYAFVRRAPEKTASGTIAAKHFLPAETMVRRQVSPRRQSWSEQKFDLPDRYGFEIRLEGSSEVLTYSVPVEAASGYKVGQRVSVVYESRGIPGIWKKNYVRTISPAE